VTETQQRFLRAIAERLGARQVMEVRLFPAIRQGQHESGVAVVAVEESGVQSPESGVQSPGGPPDAAGNEQSGGGYQPERYTILTARFRLAVKGPDRGRWEFSLVHDADAPLETLEPVVRGVARRVGDAGEPDLLSPAAFQRAVTEPWWSATA
jgi:hypothetical protein